MNAAFEPDAGISPQPTECIPPDEAGRLDALRRLKLLDSAPAESFDTVTRLASLTLRLPIVLVSLVDADRQWFKSRVGLDVEETPRRVSFCTHAVFARRPLIIPNATQDPRFLNNPLVTGPPYIRSYLGIPLYTRERYPIGTLCGIDRQQREFGAREIAMMSDFAKIIEVFVHTRELSAKTDGVLQYAMERERLFRETFEQAAVGIVHVSVTGEVLRINQRACDMLGYPQAELRKLSFMDITHPDDVLYNIREFKRTLAGEIDHYRLEQRFERKGGGYLWAQLSVALKRTAAGQPDHAIVVIEDISEIKQVQAALVLVRDSLQEQVAMQTSRLQESNAALLASNARLAAESVTDYLTGLPNRRIFSERSEAAAVAFRATGAAYGMILMDLDDFKQINDEFGHDLGDDVLRAVGAILLRNIGGDHNLAARLGGEEFAVLSRVALQEEALRALAERIRADINETAFVTAKGVLRFTSSFGLALSQPEDTDWKNVYGRADAALYEAKASGKDRVSFGHTYTRGSTLRLKRLCVEPLAHD
jgi:diguanylate cyclase (GGDEF)-like protein/PAS domain S-box-containing protein